ncbi:MAG: copper oxidase [Betaproteobacteria bacterium RIFCSPLOWO2_12_FULL_62_13]|nr:MAG: copper oxidase [Betaproteobacteria bacterium RIFCSPLOWO2_12_FULL_62_13]
MNRGKPFMLTRRELLKFGLTSGVAAALGSWGFRPGTVFGQMGPSTPNTACAGQDIREEYPTSPLILEPFKDELPIPTPLAPVPASVVATWSSPPDPGVGRQDSNGGTHQIWTTQLGLPDPIIYQIKLEVAPHSFTSSKVLPIDAVGLPVGLPPGAPVSLSSDGTTRLPESTIYGFNGTFPGSMIYAAYGQPSLVRFENHLDENPHNLDRQDFGSPDWNFLTHLHNGHTAPESDGNPHYSPNGYAPGQWVDNLYLNWPPDGDDREKQSFFWMHDHRQDHTGANVYKGLVGLYPLYDPRADPGDETKGYRLPGVPTARLSTGAVDYTKPIKYDIPLAFYDCALDDGAVRHQDWHNGCGERHPEWWGQLFHRHFPNHGFVGDIFTVNGKAYPVLKVKRRRYRLRFLDASVARIYEFKLMSSSTPPVTAASTGRVGDKLQGQWQLPDGQQSMVFTQIASEGGLLPFPIVRDSFQTWPAKRREVIVDFSKYMDGTPTTNGDVIYLVNTLQMSDGRQPTLAIDEDTGLPNPEFDPNYRVPVLKIVIDGDPAGSERDRSRDPLDYTRLVDGKATLRMVVNPKTSILVPALRMRALPLLPRSFEGVPRRTFELKRLANFGGEIQWLINGLPFEPTAPLAFPVLGSAELWIIKNGGGGWVHPLHIHEEEHRVLSRNGVRAPDAAHPDDRSKEDVVALEPGERVLIYRKFRTFTGPYVAHCHNLAHEDHSMMFGWSIVP